MIEFWKQVRHELENGRKAFLAFVAKASKGSPGTAQSRLLLCEDGRQIGTIGGGIMELNLLESAQSALAQNSFLPQLQELSHNRNASNKSGLICGGKQSNVLIVLNPSNLQTVATIVDALRAGRPSSVKINPLGLQHCDQSPRLESLSKLEIGGSDQWNYTLNLHNLRRAAIFGAGHCGQALAAQLLRLGFHVSLCDERKSLDLRFSKSKPVQLTGISYFEACERIQYWDTTAAIVMTSGYPGDLKALKACLPSHPSFIGLMGSSPKLTRIFKELEDNGFAPEAIKRITAPVGLPIGSDTPEEIAVSIAAELLQKQNTLFTNDAEFTHHIFA